MKAIELLNQNPVQGLANQTIKTGDQASESFEQVLFKSINKVNGLQVEADQQIEALSKGEQKDIHRTMISMEKAAISFELMMQVRNKIIEAYDEIRRMPI
jgi:flagellar hook-basal body complex protein FliE